MAKSWVIDKKAKTLSCDAWGGTFVASKDDAGRWRMVWRSTALQAKRDEAGDALEGEFREIAEVEIANYPGHLKRFGVDGIPAETDPIPALMQCVSFHSVHTIGRKLKLDKAHHLERWGVDIEGEAAPPVFLGPDPF